MNPNSRLDRRFILLVLVSLTLLFLYGYSGILDINISSNFHDDTSSESAPIIVPNSININNANMSINNNTQNNKRIVDFAIIGFPKCGTTYMRNKVITGSNFFYGNNQSEIYLNQFKSHADFTKLYDSITDPMIMKGFKCPDVLYSQQQLSILQHYHATTDFVISVRHPVLWFQSFYNYRLRRGFDMPDPDTLIGTCPDVGESALDGSSHGVRTSLLDHHKVCTDRANFHLALSRLGKTPMTTSAEMNLLRNHSLRSHHFPNRIFLMELGQLSVDVENRTRADAFVGDLGLFLGGGEGEIPVQAYTYNMLPKLEQRGEAKHNVKEGVNLTILNGRVMDICAPSHDALRSVLLESGKEASAWIRAYFIQSPNVVVSDETHFLDLLKTWESDPCANGAVAMHTTTPASKSSAQDQKSMAVSTAATTSHKPNVVDFAIIGFPKCSTTFLRTDLITGPHFSYGNNESEIELATLKSEVEFMKLYEHVKDHPMMKKGFKKPGILYNEQLLTILEQKHSSTDFIISIRHPVLWFQSFYNMRLRKGFDMPDPETLIGMCPNGNGSRERGLDDTNNARVPSNARHVCTDRANFHIALSRLGKTPMKTPEELNLLHNHSLHIHHFPNNRVFLMEIGQLSVDNRTRADAFVDDLGLFLGKGEEGAYSLPRLGQHVTKHSVKEGVNITKLNERMMDICDPSYDALRSVLMVAGKEASVWVRNYFIQSPDVDVSNEDHFLDLLKSWEVDPCSRK